MNSKRDGLLNMLQDVTLKKFFFKKAIIRPLGSWLIQISYLGNRSIRYLFRVVQ